MIMLKIKLIKYKLIKPARYAKAQINNMFIVSQTEDSLILIDQHAAHERIVLEKFKKKLQKKKNFKTSFTSPSSS